jgi:acetylornithine/succinyldiaminopimelate/putrescine aminotransferase
VAFDLRQTLAEHAPRAHELFADHVNPRLAGVLRTIGFNRHFTRAEGAYLWDERGDRYLDFLGGYAVCNVGRSHPDVKAALRDALEMDLPSMVQFDAPPLAAALARELQRRVGRGLDRACFTNSGTEGIEAAIKFARCATGRPAVLFAERGFHGLTLGSLSLNGCQSFRQGFAPFLPETRMVRFGDLADLEGALRAGDVAAFVVEPVQGKGVHVAPEGYLEEASRLCHRHGALLVADEVQTGVCRTGRFLAIDHSPACEPDIVVLSKALSGGMVPVGAVLCGRRTWDRVYSSMDRAIVHSSTFHMGALAMAAGLAVLHACDAGRLAERAGRMGALLRDGLERLRERYEYVRAVRQRGLMVAVEFGEPRSWHLRASWRAMHAMEPDLFAQAAVIPLFEDHRILCQVAGHGQPTVKFVPPLVIGEGDVAYFLEAFESVLRRMHGMAGPAPDLLARLARNSLSRRTYEAATADSAGALP